MEETWAISGVDLHLELHGNRVRAGLETALRDAVQTGRLAPGTRLPSSRALAADLGIARNSVAEAYGQLVAEGWLTAKQGSGTRVAAAAAPAPAPAATQSPPAIGRVRYNLRPGSPDLSAFPRSWWLSAAPSQALGYGDPRGLPELRTVLSGYLARARGVRASPDRIVVCTGFTQGLALLCQVLPGTGVTRIAVEEYGQPGPVRTLAAAGLAPAMLGVDDRGAVLDPAPDAEAMLLTPAHQFPLGAVLSPQRRADAARWAAGTGGLIIEDDYDGEFRYDRRRRDRLIDALARQVPDVRLTGIAAGLHAVVELPAGRSERQVVARAAARGVAIEGLGEYALRDHTRGPALVIGYASPPGHAYTTALARLTAAIQDQ